MATRRRVVEQHEDWLNLTDVEAPWFSLPALKRALSNGLDPTPPEVRAEHRARWYGDDDSESARLAGDRHEYIDWLLRDVLEWGSDYLTGDRLAADLAAGVTRHDVSVKPTGAYQPAPAAPVGLFDDEEADDPEHSTRGPRVLVFSLPAGTDPRARPSGDTWPATWVQRAALSCRHHHVPLALVTDGDHLTLVHAPERGTTGWGTWRASEFATEPVLLDSFRSVLRSRRFIGAAQHPDLTLRDAVRDADTPENRSWRPFQLAFILLCIPSLSDPAHPERSKEGALADLLFFPTGGGKTEAYLGLVAFTLAMRRLQGVIGEGQEAVDGRDGVAVLMRYTLRLLTAQQFQRAATLMCAAELLRQHRAETDDRYVGAPLRLGMWVGGSVSPNKARDAERFAEDARLGGFSGGQATPIQLVDCPWCGRSIDPQTDCLYDSALGRFLIFCGNAKECRFTEASAPDEGIPVVTVDEEIYRLVPAFVIGTIDKFAQLPWNGATSTLFGRVDSRCERHGYRNVDLDRSHQSHWEERDAHKPVGRHPAARTVQSLRLRPPDLIIQDEMHLVTGPLGTMTGLYETAIDRLATWSHEGRPVRPKVVASTATTRRARQQAWSVFWRHLRVFPPPVLDVHSSFFAEQVPPSPQTPGRLYLGVCAHGERLKQVELRVFSSVMAAAKAIWDELGDNGLAADPWMTTVGYFNAVRELAGMRRMAEDELRTKLRRARFTPGLANRPSVDLKELTSRVSSEDIKSILRQLFVTHEPDRDDDDDRPIDLLLATNMISVGVDVPRLASMVVVGQPKATAEYIQATSRVGRDPKGPGLVITLYNWARPRDLSHYETFSHYHATFYRHVEPLSVTPFSERALDKGLTGVLVSAVRHADHDWNPNPSARSLELTDARIDEHVQAIAERAESVTGDVSTSALATDMANKRLDAWDREAALRPQLSYAERTSGDVALLSKPEAGDWDIWTCPNSLRDTEVQANLQIEVEDPTYESSSQPEIILGQSAGPERRATVADEDLDDALEAEAAEAGAASRTRS